MKKQRVDDKKMTITVAYACLLLNLDGHKQAARILNDNGISLKEFKQDIWGSGKKEITAEMKKLLKALAKAMKKLQNGS